MLKKTAVLLIAFIILAGLLTIGPVDRRPLEQLSELTEVMETLERINFHAPGAHQLQAGWALANITPDHPVPLAGYGRRYPQTGIHDSLFVKVIVFDNGVRREAMVTIDLLLFPKMLLESIRDPETLKKLHLDGIYTGAGHTHNGFGGWDNTAVGKIVFGEYEPKLIEDLTVKIVSAIKKATENLTPARISYKKISVPELLYNRLDRENGKIDPWLRMLQIESEDGQKAALISYPAHPINIDSEIRDLSRDYPGVLTDRLELEDDIDFAMFMAGMVGSHHLEPSGLKDFELIQHTGNELTKKILEDTTITHYDSTYALGFNQFNSGLHHSQLRISKNYAVRDWVFKLALGPLEGNIEVLQIGNVLLIGMPCDFSGEISVNEQLDSLAEAKGLHLIITSFNGNYIGYITDDKYYDIVDKDEVRLLNWVGPNKGTYFADIVKKIIEKSESVD